MIEGRRKEAEGSINIGKCQDSRRRPIYTTTVCLRLNFILLGLFVIGTNYKGYL